MKNVIRFSGLGFPNFHSNYNTPIYKLAATGYPKKKRTILTGWRLTTSEGVQRRSGGQLLEIGAQVREIGCLGSHEIGCVGALKRERN